MRSGKHSQTCSRFAQPAALSTPHTAGFASMLLLLLLLPGIPSAPSVRCCCSSCICWRECRSNRSSSASNATQQGFSSCCRCCTPCFCIRSGSVLPCSSIPAIYAIVLESAIALGATQGTAPLIWVVLRRYCCCSCCYCHPCCRTSSRVVS